MILCVRRRFAASVNYRAAMPRRAARLYAPNLEQFIMRVRTADVIATVAFERVCIYFRFSKVLDHSRLESYRTDARDNRGYITARSNTSAIFTRASNTPDAVVPIGQSPPIGSTSVRRPGEGGDQWPSCHRAKRGGVPGILKYFLGTKQLWCGSKGEVALMNFKPISLEKYPTDGTRKHRIQYIPVLRRIKKNFKKWKLLRRTYNSTRRENQKFCDVVPSVFRSQFSEGVKEKI